MFRQHCRFFYGYTVYLGDIPRISYRRFKAIENTYKSESLGHSDMSQFNGQNISRQHLYLRSSVQAKMTYICKELLVAMKNRVFTTMWSEKTSG